MLVHILYSIFLKNRWMLVRTERSLGGMGFRNAVIPNHREPAFAFGQGISYS